MPTNWSGGVDASARGACQPTGRPPADRVPTVTLQRPVADILDATAAATGLPAAVVLDRAVRAWAALVAAAETGEQLWIGRPDADHLDRLTFDTHHPDHSPTSPTTPTSSPGPAPAGRETDTGGR